MTTDEIEVGKRYNFSLTVKAQHSDAVVRNHLCKVQVIREETTKFTQKPLTGQGRWIASRETFYLCRRTDNGQIVLALPDDLSLLRE